MHEDRKKVFVDEMRWDIPVVDGRYEIDQFDNDDAVYLIVTDEMTGIHRGSVRLLQTTRPHILGSVFPDLCSDGVPIGENIVELTRMVTSPTLNQLPEQWRVLQELALGVLEYGLAHGIERYSFVTHMSLVPLLMSLKWKCRRLGPEIVSDGVAIAALELDVSEAALLALRSSWRWQHEVLHSNIVHIAA